MARIELDIDDVKQEFVGNVPAELDAILKRIESTAHGVGYGKGAQKAAEDAKKQIEDAIRTETAKLEALAPLEKEKLRAFELETGELKTRLTDTMRENSKAMKAREETHAREILERTEALKKRNARIEQLTRREVRALAAEYGAREESLSELEIILSGYVAFNDDMEPFVKDLEGNPITVLGKPQPLKDFVKQYVDQHPHHRKVSGGTGGGARGGASLRAGAQAHGVPTAEAAGQRIDAGDRSAEAVNDYYKATRKPASA